MLGACIEEARPVEVTGEDLTVAFSAAAPFLKKKAENADNRAAVTAAARDVTGQRWRLSYELHEELAASESPAPPGRSEEEWVKRFMDEFDAEELPGDWAKDAPGGAGSVQDSARADEARGEALTHEEKGA